MELHYCCGDAVQVERSVRPHVVPITLKQAREFVAAHHRHNKPPVGWKFGIGLQLGEKLIGVATAGRPVARHYDDQSYGRVEVYSPTSGWFEVLTRAISELPVGRVSYVMPEKKVEADMKRSLSMMFDEARAIHEGTV